MNPHILSGGLATDDRGTLRFANDFDLSQYKRFYIISNHQQGFVRAWHGHKQEAKAFMVTQGAAIVAAVKIDDWDNPDATTEVTRAVLAGDKPSLFIIPPGFANGSMSLTADASILVFSSLPLTDAAGDDFRFPARLWDVWHIEER